MYFSDDVAAPRDLTVSTIPTQLETTGPGADICKWPLQRDMKTHGLVTPMLCIMVDTGCSLLSFRMEFYNSMQALEEHKLQLLERQTSVAEPQVEIAEEKWKVERKVMLEKWEIEKWKLLGDAQNY